MNRASTRSWWIVLMCLLCMFAGRADVANAQNRSQDVPGSRSIREVVVDPSNPQSWPEGDWQPVRRSEYELYRQLITPRAPGPDSVQIDEALYEATLKGTELIDGSLSLQIRRSTFLPGNDRERQLLPLTPLNLAVTRLAWGDEDAVWGTSPEGKTTLLIPSALTPESPTVSLNGEFSLTGRTLARGVEFTFRAAPAAVTRLRLYLPKGQKLISSVGVVSPPTASSIENHDLWQIDLGSRSRTRLSVLPIETENATDGEMLATVNSDLVISRDGLLFQSVLGTDLFRKPRSRLVILVPQRTEIESVIWSTDTPLSWRIQSSKGDQSRMVIDLPEPQIGRSRPITITGRLPLTEPLSFVSPQPLDGTVTQGAITVEVRSPLQIQDMSLTGLRQTGTVSSTMTSEIYSFEQLLPFAKLELVVSRPDVALTQEVVSHVRLDSDEWVLRSELTLRSTSGSTSSVMINIPEDWDITDLRQTSVNSRATSIALDWSTPEKLSPRIQVDLRSSITTETPVRLLLTARRLPDLSATRIELPAISVRNVESTAMLMAITPESTTSLRLDERSTYRPAIEFPTLELVGAGSPLWSQLPFPTMKQTLTVGANVLRPTGAVLLFDSDQTDTSEQQGARGAGIGTAAIKGSGGEVRTPSDYPVDAVLRSVYLMGSGARDSHIAEFSHPSGVLTSFRFALDQQAVLIGVTQDEVAVPVRSDEEGFIAILTPTSEPTRIAIRYETDADDRLISSRTVPVPILARHPRSFRWIVERTPSVELFDAPDGMLPLDANMPASWTQILFGPLGRSRDETFNPLRTTHWKELASRAVGVNGALVEQNSAGNFRASNAWLSVGYPESVEVRLWNHDRGVMLTWTLLLGSLLIGVLVRVIRLSWRGKLAAVWLGLMILAVGLLPAIPGRLAGASIMGTVLSMLMPRLLLPRWNSDPAGSVVPMGSTQQISNAGLTLLLISIGLLFPVTSQLMAQDDPASRRQPAEELIVLVPDMPNTDSSDVVYVSRELRKAIDDRISKARNDASWLVSSARYEAMLDTERLLTLKATYRVTAIGSNDVVTIHLPVRNAILAGADACRVNGVPVAVLPAKNGDGFLVELQRTPAPRRTVSGALIAPRPTPGPERFEIELNLYPIVERARDGGRSEVELPSVTNSRLTWSVKGDAEWLSIRTPSGEVYSDQKVNRLSVTPGSTEKLALSWSSTQEPIALPATISAEVTSLVEVHPTYRDYFVHVKHNVLQGETNFLSWPIPSGCLLREIHSEGLQSATQRTASNGQSLILLEFSSPRSTTFDVYARLTLPVSDGQRRLASKRETDSLRAAVPFLFSPARTSRVAPVLSLARQVLAVSAPAAWELSTVEQEIEGLRVVATDDILSGWKSPIRLPNRMPWQAWSVVQPAVESTPLELTLERREQVLSAKLTQVGQIESRRLDWTVSAALQTSGAPAFQIQFVVDPRLHIESISARESGAERLLRYARNESVVTLFFRDPISEQSTVVINGWMPLQQELLTDLPVVSLPEATLSATELLLYQEPGVTVELARGDGLARQMEDTAATADASRIKLGKFQWDLSSRPPAITVTDRLVQTEYDLLTMFESPDNDSIQTRTILRFERPVEELIITHPESIAPMISASNVEVITEPNPEGTRVEVRSGMLANEPVQLTIQMAAPAASGSSLPEPGVILPAGRLRRRIWFVPDDTEIQPSAGVASIESEQVSAWMLEQLPAEGALFEGDGGDASFSTVTRTIDGPRQVVHLLETEVIEHADRTTGLTRILMTNEGRNDFEVSWPQEFELIDITINDQLTDVAVDDGVLRFDSKSTESAAEIILRWTVTFDIPGAVMSVTPFTIPAPMTIQPEVSMLALLAPSGVSPIARESINAIAPRDYSQAIHEAIVRWIEDQPQSRPLHEQHASHLRSHAAGLESLESEHSHVPDRIHTALAFAKAASAESSGALDSRVLLAKISDAELSIDDLNPGESPDGTEVRTASTSLSIWQLRPTAFRMAIGLLGLALIIPVMGWLFRESRGNWLAKHPHTSFGILGLLWWMLLAVSAIGFLMFAIAGGTGIWKYFRRHRLRKKDVVVNANVITPDQKYV